MTKQEAIQRQNRRQRQAAERRQPEISECTLQLYTGGLPKLYADITYIDGSKVTKQYRSTRAGVNLVNRLLSKAMNENFKYILWGNADKGITSSISPVIITPDAVSFEASLLLLPSLALFIGFDCTITNARDSIIIKLTTI